MPREPEQPVATQTTAPYAFWGLEHELKKGAPLEEGESVLLADQIQCRTSWLIRRPCFIRLTDRRLVFVLHYAFQPDRLICIPAGALLEVTLVENWIKLCYRSQDELAIITVRSPRLHGAYEPDDDSFDADDEDFGPDTRGLAVALSSWMSAANCPRERGQEVL
jgi:hypothetical protein